MNIEFQNKFDFQNDIEFNNTFSFKDKRGREWEAFVDLSYFDCICVRLKSDRDFNSPTSFHFVTYEQAKQFVELIKVSG